MDKVVITFRDFTAHLVPGLIYFGIFLFCFPEILNLLEANKLLFSLVGLFASYAVGFVADTIFFPKLNKFIRWIPFLKDPITKYFKVREFDVSNSIQKKTIELLSDHLGEELVKNTKPTVLVYVCIRYVELKNEYAAGVLSRINSLANLSIAMAPPLVLFAAILLWKQYFLLAGISIALAYFTLRKNLFYREWLARTAIRHYSLIRLDELNANSR